MRDIKGAFQRTSEISREVSKTSGWLEDFAEQMALKEQVTKTASITKEARAVTAVEVARNKNMQPSIYEMMSAIVSGNKPKFSSVEEAVKDYQERTGLAQYLKAQEEERMAAYAAVINDYKDYGHESEFNVDPKIVLKEIIDLLSSDEPYALDSAAQLFEGIIDTFLINNNYNLKESDRFQLKNKLLRYVAEHNKEGAENLAEILGMNESNPKLLEESYDDSYLDIGTPVEPVGPSTNTADQMSADDDASVKFMNLKKEISDLIKERKRLYSVPGIEECKRILQELESLSDVDFLNDEINEDLVKTTNALMNFISDNEEIIYDEAELRREKDEDTRSHFSDEELKDDDEYLGEYLGDDPSDEWYPGMDAKKMSADDGEDEEDEDEDDCKTSLAEVIRQFRLETSKKKSLAEADTNNVEWNEEKQRLESMSDTGEADDKPEIVMKNPAIEHFIINIIDTNHGIQVPALLHSLVETFARDGVSQSVFSDKPLLNWINQKLINKQHLKEEIPSQIGRGVGTQIDYSGEKDSNRDPFVLLVPDKGIF